MTGSDMGTNLPASFFLAVGAPTDAEDAHRARRRFPDATRPPFDLSARRSDRILMWLESELDPDQRVR